MASRQRSSKSSRPCTASVAEYGPIVLRPGEIWFGPSPACVRTLLGSCVAITLWHPERHIGGMCHYLLSGQNELERNRDRPGYYATGAIRYFQETVSEWSTRPEDYEVKIFGGGNMFPSVDRRANSFRVAEDNIEHGRQLLEKAGFSLHAQDVGGARSRTVLFELWSGDVWVRYGHDDRTVAEGATP